MNKRLEATRSRLESATRIEDRWANTATVVLFLALGVLTLKGVEIVDLPGAWILGVAVSVLAVLMTIRSRAGRRRRRAGYAVDWMERAQERRRGLYVFGQDDGSEYVDRGHRYSYDLDLFGPASLFERLNACHTVLGRDHLSGFLTRHAGRVPARQAAVRELRDALDEREMLEVELRSLVDDSLTHPDRLAKQTRAVIAWGEGPSPALADASSVWLCRLLPVLSVVGVVAWLGLGWTWVVAAVPYGINVFFARRVKDLGPLMKVFESVRRTLEAWARTVETSAAFQFQATVLRDVLDPLTVEHAPEAIRELRRLAERLSQRRNAFWAMTGNIVFLSDVRARHALARWHREHGRGLSVWLRSVAELEAWASLAAYAESVPDACWPVLSDDGPVLEARGLAHPLLPRDRVVANSCEMKGSDAIWIVTGSNMSGKSTFLRAVGLVVVMTELGVPIVAESVSLRALRLATSMNVEDSLREGTSRFHAEVKRLRRCLDWASEGLTLVLLDEILAGTNSEERRLGTVAVLEQLGELGSPTLVSTHDLGLADVAKGWDREQRVVHFTDRVENGEMFFDYRLREGRLPSTNALEVLRAEGIQVSTPEETVP